MKDVEFGEVDVSELRVKPTLPKLGPKLGDALRDVREQLQRGEFEELEGGCFQVDGHELEVDEVLVARVGLRAGPSPATTTGRSPSTRRSTTNCCGRAASTIASTR